MTSHRVTDNRTHIISNGHNLNQVLYDILNAHDENPGIRFETASSIFGEHGLRYDRDEEGTVYVLVGFTLPAGVYVEIDDSTYGTLQGFRILLDTTGAYPNVSE